MRRRTPGVSVGWVRGLVVAEDAPSGSKAAALVAGCVEADGAARDWAVSGSAEATQSNPASRYGMRNFDMGNLSEWVYQGQQ
jgi:hypothetical protein